MDTRGFYDGPADRYDLIHADRDASTARQGRALDALLTTALGPGPHTVLDTACGIGTQSQSRSLGLAALGHRVTGTDLSPASSPAPPARPPGAASPCPSPSPTCGPCPSRRPPSTPWSARTTPCRTRRADGDLPAVALARRRGAVRRGALPAAADRRHLDHADVERDVGRCRRRRRPGTPGGPGPALAGTRGHRLPPAGTHRKAAGRAVTGGQARRAAGSWTG